MSPGLVVMASSSPESKAAHSDSPFTGEYAVLPGFRQQTTLTEEG